MKPKKTIIPLDVDNDYVKAAMKSFRQFLIEESTGTAYADSRLQKRLEAARLLYPDERKSMCKQRYFGRWDESNVELFPTSRE